ncbi:MAG: tetratricopeptide repeat protein [Crocinitomicaceae bacterium]|nr:tetratricopeptide repeat protein [Crocinitomicaceae bacterium]
MFDDEEREDFEGDLNEDIKRFDAFLKGEPIGFMDSCRWEVLVDHLLISGNYSKALKASDEALSQFSFNSIFKLRKAQAYSGLGKLKEAIQLLSQIERLGMPSFELLLTKASVFSQLKDSKNAIRYFTAALDAASKEERDEIYLDLAVEYENSGNYKAALKVLKEAVQSNPNNESAIYEIAFCYDHLGEFQNSIKCYSDFINENPYSFTAWYNLGNAYSKLEDFDKAIWAYDYCILINDDFGPVYFNIANAFLAKEKFAAAIEHFHKCIELDGDDPIALCYIGECHEQMDELELAKMFYKRSLELAPLLPDAWLGLGIIEDLEGRTREGITLIRKASELDPENAGIYHVLAGAYEKIEEIDEANECYQLSLALDPNDEECLTNYIASLVNESLIIAFDYLNSFEEIEQNNNILPILKVNLLWGVGKKTDAIHLFKECIENNKAKALDLFVINPSLKNVPELVLLADN